MRPTATASRSWRRISIFTLHKGDSSSVGHRGLIAAGTGLGEAMLIWDGKSRHLPIASEGGHCDFAARTDQEIALLQYLRRTLNGRVSFERVVSGIGIKNVYAFLRDDQKMEEPAWLRERLQQEDPNAVIGECGENGSSEICAETLKIFAGGLWRGVGQHRAEGAGHGRHVSGRRHRAEDSEDAAEWRVHARRFSIRDGCRRCWSRFRCG